MPNVCASLAIILLVALAAPGNAPAQSSNTKGGDLRALGDRSAAPVKKPGGATAGMKACPEYGAGFYRLAGSDTCVRIGGGVASDVGASVRGR